MDILFLENDINIIVQEFPYKCKAICGISAESDTVGRSVKAQMKYANKIGAKYSLIIGDEEVKNDLASLKCMDTGEIQEVKLSELEKYLQKIDKVLEL